MAALVLAQASRCRPSSRGAWPAWRVCNSVPAGAPPDAAGAEPSAPPAELGRWLGLGGRGALGSSTPLAAGGGARRAACSRAAVAAALRSGWQG